MMQKKKINQSYLEGERPLFQGKHLEIHDTIFAKGSHRLRKARIFHFIPPYFSGNIRFGTAGRFMRRTVPGSKWRGQVFGIPRILRSSGRSLKLRKTSAAVGA